jgi:hypothetical protein
MKTLIITLLTLSFSLATHAASLKDIKAREDASKAAAQKREDDIAAGIIVPEYTYDCTFITSKNSWTEREFFSHPSITFHNGVYENGRYVIQPGQMVPLSEEMVVRLKYSGYENGGYDNKKDADAVLEDIVCVYVPPTE